jgi:hypothetical protein
MSHFYGHLRGSRGAVTRCGGKGSGIRAHARGWDVGGRVTCFHKDGKDHVRFTLTGGSNGSQRECDLGSFTRDDLNRKALLDSPHGDARALLRGLAKEYRDEIEGNHPIDGSAAVDMLTDYIRRARLLVDVMDS